MRELLEDTQLDRQTPNITW